MPEVCHQPTGIDKTQSIRHSWPQTNKIGGSQSCTKGRFTTMKVAIIGAGNVGKALATSISRAGHDVTISAKHAEHAQQAAAEIGATPADSNASAAADADVVILAVPYGKAGEEVATDIRDEVAGRTVIDVTNPL